MYSELELYEFLMYKKEYSQEEAHNLQWKYELYMKLSKEEEKDIIAWRSYITSGKVASH